MCPAPVISCTCCVYEYCIRLNIPSSSAAQGRFNVTAHSVAAGGLASTAFRISVYKTQTCYYFLQLYYNNQIVSLETNIFFLDNNCVLYFCML